MGIVPSRRITRASSREQSHGQWAVPWINTWDDPQDRRCALGKPWDDPWMTHGSSHGTTRETAHGKTLWVGVGPTGRPMGRLKGHRVGRPVGRPVGHPMGRRIGHPMGRSHETSLGIVEISHRSSL